MKPTMGRIVHICWPDGTVSPAIVTRTNADSAHMLSVTQRAVFGRFNSDRWGNKPLPSNEMADDMVDVQVFGLAQTYPLYQVPYAPKLTVGCWSWPERDE